MKGGDFMVLRLDVLRLNVWNYMKLATAVKVFFDDLEIENSGFAEAFEASRVNLEIIDSLLEAGITEVQVPGKSC